MEHHPGLIRLKYTHSQHWNWAPVIARMGVYRARPGLCLCPKVARIAEHKFGNR